MILGPRTTYLSNQIKEGFKNIFDLKEIVNKQIKSDILSNSLSSFNKGGHYVRNS